MNSAVNRAAFRSVRNVFGRRAMSSHGDTHLTPRQVCIDHKMTIDNLPVPLGRYAEVYSAKQRKYNLHLFLSIAATIGLMWAAISTKVWLFPDTKRDIDLSKYYSPEADTRYMEQNVYLEVVEKDE